MNISVSTDGNSVQLSHRFMHKSTAQVEENGSRI